MCEKRGKSEKKICRLSQPVLLLQQLQASLVHLLNQRLRSLLAALLIKGFFYLFIVRRKSRGRGRRKEKDAICVFLAR